MAASSVIEFRIGSADGVLQAQCGPVAVDVPRSVGYFGGIAVAVAVGLIEPPLGAFIAAVPLFKALTNTRLPWAVRAVLEGAAKPVGSDAEGVVQLEDQARADEKVVKIPVSTAPRRSRRGVEARG